MKKLLLLLLIALCFFGCKKSPIEIIDKPEVIKPHKIELSFDKSLIKANGIEEVKITTKVIGSNGFVMIEAPSIKMNDLAFIGNTFKTNTPGEYRFQAILGALLSDIYTLKAIKETNTTFKFPFQALELRVGESKSIEIGISDTDYPINQIRLESTNTTIATISTHNTVKAVSAGLTEIKAFYGSVELGKFTLTVSNIEVSSIKLDIENTRMYENELLPLKASILPQNATNKNVTWTSSNTSVAIVNENGVVTSKKGGEVEITAISNNQQKAVCKIIVVTPKIYSTTEYLSVMKSLNNDVLPIFDREINSLIDAKKFKKIEKSFMFFNISGATISWTNPAVNIPFYNLVYPSEKIGGLRYYTTFNDTSVKSYYGNIEIYVKFLDNKFEVRTNGSAKKSYYYDQVDAAIQYLKDNLIKDTNKIKSDNGI